MLDDGVGVTAEYMNKLFKTSELHTTIDKAEEKGTTLGLILCREFVEKHGGNIWAERVRGKDQSIEIKFTMPVVTLLVREHEYLI